MSRTQEPAFLITGLSQPPHQGAHPSHQGVPKVGSQATNRTILPLIQGPGLKGKHPQLPWKQPSHTPHMEVLVKHQYELKIIEEPIQRAGPGGGCGSELYNKK